MSKVKTITIMVKSITHGFVCYDRLNRAGNPKFEDYMPESVYADPEALKTMGIVVKNYDDFKVAHLAKVEPAKAEKSKKAKAKKEVEEQTEDEKRKQANVDKLADRIETTEEEPESVEEDEPKMSMKQLVEEIKEVATLAEESVKDEPVQPELELEDNDLPIEEIEAAAKTKPKTMKLIEQYAGNSITEYTYDPSAGVITVELEDSKIFEASTKVELLENIYLAYN